MTNVTEQALGADAPMPPRFRGTPPPMPSLGSEAIAVAEAAWSASVDGPDLMPRWAVARLRTSVRKYEAAAHPAATIRHLATWIPTIVVVYREVFEESHRYALAPKLLENATFNALDLAAELGESIDKPRFREAISRAARQGNAQVARAYTHLTTKAAKEGSL